MIQSVQNHLKTYIELRMTSPETPNQHNDPTVTTSIPEHYTIGDNLKWDAPWINVRLWTELPFWLMVDNTTVLVECEGHEFPVAIHDNYFELFFGMATDSRATALYRGPFKEREELSPMLKNGASKRSSKRLPLQARQTLPRSW